MAEFTETLTDDHVAMIERQPLFFVATAAEDARINLSPKGYDSFRVLSPSRAAYLDLGGSGNETNAHLLADGRITLMFCKFDQPALLPGTRQIFDVQVESVQTSCGWGVPLMDLKRERHTLLKAHSQADPLEWAGKYKTRRSSIDGLPVRPTDRYIKGASGSIPD